MIQLFDQYHALAFKYEELRKRYEGNQEETGVSVRDKDRQ